MDPGVSKNLLLLSSINFDEFSLVPSGDFVGTVKKPSLWEHVTNPNKEAKQLYKAALVFEGTLRSITGLFRDAQYNDELRRDFELTLKLVSRLFYVTIELNPYIARSIQKILCVIQNHAILEALS